jgi:ketosteroid isomerase-like protein
VAHAAVASFSAALLARDPIRAAACFAKDGRLLTPDGTEMTGRLAIAEVFRQLEGTSLRLTLEPGRITSSGPLALSVHRLVLSSAAKGVEPFERAFACCLTLRDDGTRWWIQLAAPWSLGVSGRRA